MKPLSVRHASQTVRGYPIRIVTPAVWFDVDDRGDRAGGARGGGGAPRLRGDAGPNPEPKEIPLAGRHAALLVAHGHVGGEEPRDGVRVGGLRPRPK